MKSILKLNSRISSRFEILRFHTAWALFGRAERAAECPVSGDIELCHEVIKGRGLQRALALLKFERLFSIFQRKEDCPAVIDPMLA